MKKKFEATYGKTLKGLMVTINPIKKRIMKTHCIVHKFINIQAIEILKNKGYREVHTFYKSYVKELNNGVTWADQDFKSSNHFYHHITGTGLYGFSNALTEFNKYYKCALRFVEAGDLRQALFYFGAACHLIQDATVPQHVNNKLLKNHRNFELWIIGRLMSDYSFPIFNEIIKQDNIEDYIKNNATFASDIYISHVHIKNKEERYRKVSTLIVQRAQKTTAGLMLNFYNEIYK
ncbi:zinc dependent phospholipase C family protein [Clostridium estertheticum]|uniref:Phospholipase C n=1 Tax=Clostridium estertheticum TaxID=238834 RepID=A0A7Y3SVJ4_9CLOT|nr:zinc dependent phospholipase C family protein [Clostridium estertheticum]MBW9169781.1 zinc dependent phospholipase C family protein [Clostridium estertheticum]MBX4265866.1 zinc dependent phospholipase C family protein [Clostridium estertheticum]MBX4269479.1 zinc dependent phospholipase C family protein [Clostridium estertheticum]MCB2306517.1 zinc dependent phospholipase C family protein [Clostridium estertheticum]MCB2345105.1 zinc dependent phospholipase C family protein [Clostridium estert